MPRSDDLRHTLHDPDYWLGPAEPLGAGVFAAIGTALGGLVCALISLGGLIILGWWIRSIMAALGSQSAKAGRPVRV